MVLHTCSPLSPLTGRDFYTQMQARKLILNSCLCTAPVTLFAADFIVFYMNDTYLHYFRHSVPVFTTVVTINFTSVPILEFFFELCS